MTNDIVVAEHPQRQLLLLERGAVQVGDEVGLGDELDQVGLKVSPK